MLYAPCFVSCVSTETSQMEKLEIIKAIESKHQDLIKLLDEMPEQKWESGPDGKWTTGQHILHLVKTGEMLNSALSYPKFLIRYKFGVSNRPSRSYDEVARRYDEKLSKNEEKVREFNKSLRVPSPDEKQYLLDELIINSKKLQYKTKRIRDKRLDKLLLPHPLMGKMTLREIIMWSAYHTDYHYRILKENY